MARDSRIVPMRSEPRPETYVPTGGSSGSGGSGGSDLERRVSVVESELREIRLSLQNVQLLLAKIDAKLDSQADRIGKVETEVGSTLQAAIGRTIGPASFVGIVASCAAIAGFALAAGRWLIRQPWF